MFDLLDSVLEIGGKVLNSAATTAVSGAIGDAMGSSTAGVTGGSAASQASDQQRNSMYQFSLFRSPTNAQSPIQPGGTALAPTADKRNFNSGQAYQPFAPVQAAQDWKQALA